jgi:arabinogalactan oligomer/maltooligosaccharide transport system substrate-binding protein
VTNVLSSRWAVPLVLIAALIAGLFVSAPAHAAPRAILVWVDAPYKDAASELFAKGYKNRSVTVQVKDMSTIVTDLQNINPEKAPDIILIDNDQVGELAGAALITPLEISSATSRALSSIAVNGFKYGESIFGIPMQRQNVALVTNATMIPTAPTTFKKLSSLALKTVADGVAQIPFALPQGLDGDSYSTYPLFAGLGGFAYGTNSFGSINTNSVGINNKKFRKNQSQIDEWNKSGLLNSALTADEARAAFLQGQSPFWITGPDDIANLRTVNFRYRITVVPTIVKGFNTSPLMKSIGFAVTSFASQHKVLPASRDLVTNINSTVKAQTTFYSKSPYVGLPANTAAAAASPDRVLLAFGSSAIGALPYPNVPEWGTTSLALGGAWRDSTRGGDAVPAAQAFAGARAQVIAAQAAAAAPAAPTAPVIP